MQRNKCKNGVVKESSLFQLNSTKKLKQQTNLSPTTFHIYIYISVLLFFCLFVPPNFPRFTFSTPKHRFTNPPQNFITAAYIACNDSDRHKTSAGESA